MSMCGSSFTTPEFITHRFNMEIKDIPRNYFSLPAETIANTLAGLNKNMQEEEVDHWLFVLRQNAKKAFLPNLPSSRPSDLNHEFRLPGIGHQYWNTARDHVFAGSSPPRILPEFVQPLRSASPEMCSAFIANFKADCETSDLNQVYTIDWMRSQFIHDYELGIIFDAKVIPQIPGIFQDGSPIEEHSVLHSFHGTREIALKSILSNGLRSSTRAHKVVGVWLNDHRPSAVQWNTSLLDSTPFLCCNVKANKAFDRQNADIMQGQDNRRISELRPGMVLPSVLITSVFMGVPHQARSQWRRHIFDACMATFSYIKTLHLKHQDVPSICQLQWATVLFQLTAARVAYRETDGAMLEDFGGPFSEVPSSVIPISISLTKLLDALQTNSERNRTRKLFNFSLMSLPRPIREVILIYFPELRVWTNRNFTSEFNEQWTLGTVTAVKKWFCQ